MRIPLAVLAAVAALLVLLYVLAPPQPGPGEARTDLPWQVTALPDGSSRVFGLRLGEATLAEAVARFGPHEDAAVFVDPDGRRSLEAYFGTVQFGPLTARLVVTLAATDAELDALVARAAAGAPAASGSWRHRLDRADHGAQRARRLTAISYLPGYDGLDAGFYRERFGVPAAWKRIDAHRVQWFYPALGVSLLLDDEGREVVEYVAPRDLRLPPGLEWAAAPP